VQVELVGAETEAAIDGVESGIAPLDADPLDLLDRAPTNGLELFDVEAPPPLAPNEPDRAPRYDA
jgi:hypothetical protein